MSRIFTVRDDWRGLPIRANRQPGFAAYAREGDHYQLHTLQVFTVRDGLIQRMTTCQDQDVFALFDLPEIFPSHR